MTHDCGHVGYVSRIRRIVMSYGFCTCDLVRAYNLFHGFWVVARYGAAYTYKSGDGFQTMTHYESWLGWHKSMWHAGLGLREERLYKGTPGAWDLGQAPRPLRRSTYLIQGRIPCIAYTTTISTPPPNPSPDGDRTYPRRQSGLGCCHLAHQHPHRLEPPSRSPSTQPYVTNGD